jgi:hypothetical protein
VFPVWTPTVVVTRLCQLQEDPPQTVGEWTVHRVEILERLCKLGAVPKAVFKHFREVRCIALTRLSRTGLTSPWRRQRLLEGDPQLHDVFDAYQYTVNCWLAVRDCCVRLTQPGFMAGRYERTHRRSARADPVPGD